MNSTMATTWMEHQWQQLFEGSENPTVRLAIVLFTWHQIVFVGRYIPYVICDHIPFLRKYRIQEDKDVSPELWWTCAKAVLAEQLFLQLPMMMAFKPVGEYLGMEFMQVPLPSWSDI